MRAMKTYPLLSLVFLSALTPLLHAAESKHTVEYILATPSEFEGKEVTLDVSFVKPVQWKSPIPELAFFHAVTIDRRDKKPGGRILVAILAADAAKFSKKYGMDFEGRNASNDLKGVLLASPVRAGMRGRIWMIDTTGQAEALIKANKLRLPDLDAMGPRETLGAKGRDRMVR